MERKYWRDTSGNAAVMFCVSMLMLLAGVGAAIDFNSASNLRSNYQDMADAAVLAAARTKSKEESRMGEIADKTVRTMNATGTNPTVQTTLSSDKKKLQVYLSGTYTNRFMQLFGKDTHAVSAVSETLIEINDDVEIVMVLDTTRSMNYLGRLSSLKQASGKFLDVIESVDAGDRLRVSVVPFGQYVNVGLSQRNQDWIDVPADYVETFPQQCSMQRGPVTGQNCQPGVTSPTPSQPAQPPRPATPPTYGTCTDDGVSYSCQTSPGSPAQPGRPAVAGSPGGQPTTHCTNIYDPDQRVCTTPSPVHHKWHGCVGSRRNSFNVQASYATGEPKVPGFLDLHCGSEILPMTSNLSTVRSKINGLTTNGETYSPAGLIWGHRLVDPAEPFAFNRTTEDGRPPRRVVLFMTDGFNTKSRTGELHDGSSRSDADDVSEDICDAMRDDPTIEVYSVAFQVSDNQAKRLVRDCATFTDMYYDASNAQKLNEAFEDIGYSLLSPRLTR